MVVFGFALMASTWILALFSDSQAAIAGASVMTMACVGVVIIDLMLDRLF